MTDNDNDLSEQIADLERRLEALVNDPLGRLLTENVRKVNADRKARYIAAAKEKDPFWRAAKKPFVFDEFS